MLTHNFFPFYRNPGLDMYNPRKSVSFFRAVWLEQLTDLTRLGMWRYMIWLWSVEAYVQNTQLINWTSGAVSAIRDLIQLKRRVCYENKIIWAESTCVAMTIGPLSAQNLTKLPALVPDLMRARGDGGVSFENPFFFFSFFFFQSHIYPSSHWANSDLRG